MRDLAGGNNGDDLRMAGQAIFHRNQIGPFSRGYRTAIGQADGASVLGFVGAGGIGLYLANEIQQAECPRVAFLIIMILITVGAIDWVSSKRCFAIIGKSRPAKQALGAAPGQDRRQYGTACRNSPLSPASVNASATIDAARRRRFAAKPARLLAFRAVLALTSMLVSAPEIPYFPDRSIFSGRSSAR
ncbi:MAG: PhnE/PtxC family ABC transporter permease [Dongiaceae bacterium]